MRWANEKKKKDVGLYFRIDIQPLSLFLSLFPVIRTGVYFIKVDQDLSLYSEKLQITLTNIATCLRVCANQHDVSPLLVQNFKHVAAILQVLERFEYFRDQGLNPV